MVHKNNFSETYTAWTQFIKAGKLDNVSVQPDIHQSWCRCFESGLDPEADIQPDLLNEERFQTLLKRKKPLIMGSLPFMQKISVFLMDTDFLIMLADEQACILEILGSDQATIKGKEINLVPGSRWNEETAGTNGIGTALKILKPVQVYGDEHYCKQLHGWTGSAAPILDHNGQLNGILGIYRPDPAGHPHTLGMTMAAAEVIAEQMQNKQQSCELMLSNNRLFNIINSISEGILIVNRYGLVEQANPIAERILRTPAEGLEGLYINELSQGDTWLRDLLTKGITFSNIQINVKFNGENIRCLVSGRAIKGEEERISGGVIILNPVNENKNRINHYEAHAQLTFADIIGHSSKMKEAIMTAKLAARNESNVLLQGESGTGKEVFAQAIHNGSKRSVGPFVAINCAAMPRDLLASELFGYVEGAFTGAKKGGQAGKFELASGGTLFLDEIGDVDLGEQGMLLRAIQEKVITRIGDYRVIPVDVRIICATNQNLEEQVENGKFRQDLFYRLNVFRVDLSPLRHHKEDIPLLFNYFVQKISQRQGLKINAIEPEVLAELSKYSWPGNVRQLENVAERMVCMTRYNVISLQDIPGEITEPSYTETVETITSGAIDCSDADDSAKVNTERERLEKILEEQDKKEISELISRFGGNISQVAKEMGVARSTVYRKMKQYNLSL